jgi:hypothetical protein
MSQHVRRPWGTLLVGSLLLAGCGEVRTYEILPYQLPCTGVGPRLCMVVKAEGSGESQFFYEGIQGFEYRWGETQTVRVRVEEVSDPPQDASSKSYFLEEVISTVPAPEGTTFEARLTSRFLTGNTTQGFILGSSKALECATQAVCQTLAQRAAGDVQETFKLVLRLPGTPEQPLIVESVQ